MSHSHRVTGPEAETAGIRFRLATATTKSRTRSRRPSTRSRVVFFPVGSGRIGILFGRLNLRGTRVPAGAKAHPFLFRFRHDFSRAVTDRQNIGLYPLPTPAPSPSCPV